MKSIIILGNPGVGRSVHSAHPQFHEIANAILTNRALNDRDRFNAHSNERKRESERLRQERCNSLIII